MPDINQVEDRLKAFVAKHLNIDPVKITPDARFGTHLGADHLDILEVIMWAEDEFGHSIPDEEFDCHSTFGQLVAAASRQFQKRA